MDTITPDTPVTPTAEQILANVRALGPLIREEADAVNRDQVFPPRLADALREAGVYRIAFPPSWGGPQMSMRDQILLIEELCSNDASTGWVIMITADGGYYGLMLEDDVAEDIYTSIDLSTAGAARPAGRADVVEGGYLLNGDWSFGSGIRNAQIIVGGFHKYVDGEPVLNDLGFPELFWGFMPADKVTIHDNWVTTGLTGSGSTSYSIRDAFVPEGWIVPFGLREGDPTAPPLNRHGAILAFNANGVPLGIAKRGLEEFHAFMNRPTRSDPRGRALKETNVMLPFHLAKATALYDAARAMALHTAAELDEVIFSGGSWSAEQHARAGYAGWVINQLCRQSLETVMEIVGARGVLAENAFDRLYRDMSTIARHNAYNDTTLTNAGNAMIGKRGGTHLIA